MSPAKYGKKVRAKSLIPDATPSTCNVTSTNSTGVFYVEESDTNDTDGEGDSSVSTESSNGVRATVKDAVATITTEIMELDKIGFDETLDVDETLDM